MGGWGGRYQIANHERDAPTLRALIGELLPRCHGSRLHFDISTPAQAIQNDILPKRFSYVRISDACPKRSKYESTRKQLYRITDRRSHMIDSVERNLTFGPGTSLKSLPAAHGCLFHASPRFSTARIALDL